MRADPRNFYNIGDTVITACGKKGVIMSFKVYPESTVYTVMVKNNMIECHHKEVNRIAIGDGNPHA